MIPTDNTTPGIVTKGLASWAGYLQTFINGVASIFLPAEPYFHVFDFTLAGNQVLNDQPLDMQLPFEFDVHALGCTYAADHSDFSFLFKGTGGGIFFGNQKINASALYLRDGDPVFWFHRPFTIAPLASMSIDLQELSGNAYTGQLVLCGYKSQSQYTTP
jgi:hypothetical protein